jgi:hypothetical protein
VSAPFTAAELEQAIRDEASEHPETTNPATCRYRTAEGQTCIVGAALLRLGADLPDLDDILNGLSYERLAERRGWPCSGWISEAQAVADTGFNRGVLRPWAEVIERTDAIFERAQ